MALLFTDGTLKKGFCNEHINTGEQQPGRYRTRERLPFYLMNDGHVPCVIHQPGTGHQVIGELYRAGSEALAGMDRLERIGEAGGYTRITLAVERLGGDQPEVLTAHIYARLPADVQAGEQRSACLSEYTLAHQARFVW